MLRDKLRSDRTPATQQTPQGPTHADAAGLKELGPEQIAGARAAGAAAGKIFDAKIAAVERYQQERADYIKQRDEAIWRKIEERRRYTI